MNRLLPILTSALVASVSAAEVPAVFSGILEKDVPVRAQIGVILPPQDIEKYVAKVEQAARKDPEWFREASSKAKSGAPLPYDEKLGLTKEEYDNYLSLWAKREFKPIEEVLVVLRQSGNEQWTISCTGTAGAISTLRYSSKDDIFRSPNGELKRIEDINADASSILGAWTGKEWRFEEENTLAKIKENIAVGQYSDKKFGLLVYRVQEVSSEGTRLLDKSLVIRFPMGKAATPAPAPQQKPATPTQTKKK